MLLTLIAPQRPSAASAIWNSRPVALWVSRRPEADVGDLLRICSAGLPWMTGLRRTT